MKSFAFLLALSVSVFCKEGIAQLLDEDCVPPLAPKIKGGKVAPPGTTPWMAQLIVNYQFMCGGTLIHPWFVLTAAHCFNETDQLSVILGQYETFCHPTNCSQSEEINVIKAIHHPEYERQTQESDIALLKLEKQVAYKPKIRSICIVMDDGINQMPIYVFWAYGWGETVNAYTSRVLQTIPLIRSDPRFCRSSYSDKEICAGAYWGIGDTCYGDSGGPIVANITYFGSLITMQFGITSRGSLDCDSFGIYTNVYGFKQWIKDTVLANTENKKQLLDHNCSNIWHRSGDIRQPWKVHIIPNYKKGALITKRFVVTVAKDLPTETEKVKVEALGGGTFSVEAVYKHPDFRSYPLITNNIALIKLNTDVPYSDFLAPICLRPNSQQFVEPPTWLTAILRTWDFSINNPQKQVNFPVIDHLNCGRIIGKELEETQFCLNLRDISKVFGKTDISEVFGKTEEYESDNKFFLHGITSFESKGLTILTNIQSYMAWIERTINF